MFVEPYMHFYCMTQVFSAMKQPAERLSSAFGVNCVTPYMENSMLLLLCDLFKKDLSLLVKEFYQILNDCLGKLPHKLANVFKMKMLLEEKSEVICKTLNISDANYWVILHRAKLQLRACMHNNWRK